MASSLSSIDQPISILSEHIASRPTTLRFKNHGRGGSTITDITDEAAPQELFKIGAKKTGMTSIRREVRDSKDTLLFSLRRDMSGYYTFLDRPHNPLDLTPHYYATIDPLATGLKDKFDVRLEKPRPDITNSEPEIKLEVRGQDIWKKNALVYHGEDIVMQVRFVQLLTAYVPFKSNEWDVYIAKGMDLSLASAIVCYLASSLYDSAHFGAMREYQNGDSHSGASRGWKYGMMAGAAAGGAGAGGGGGGC